VDVHSLYIGEASCLYHLYFSGIKALVTWHCGVLRYIHYTPGFLDTKQRIVRALYKAARPSSPSAQCFRVANH
jgi:hypothetical protein